MKVTPPTFYSSLILRVGTLTKYVYFFLINNENFDNMTIHMDNIFKAFVLLVRFCKTTFI
jgi:hypothetical protein